MEYRLTFTTSSDPELCAVQMLSGFEKAVPEVGPAVGGDLVAKTLEVTFSLDAQDVDAAIELGRRIFAKGYRASGLAPARVTSMEVSEVPFEDSKEAHELQPA